MTLDTKANTPKEIYDAAHDWLHKNFGKADRCDMRGCANIPKRFEWALKKGFIYQKKRKAFLMLCVSCHRKYDFTDQTRENMSEAHMGNKGTFAGMSHTEETKQRISNTKKGKPWTEARRLAQEKRNR